MKIYNIDNNKKKLFRLPKLSFNLLEENSNKETFIYRFLNFILVLALLMLGAKAYGSNYSNEKVVVEEKQENGKDVVKNDIVVWENGNRITEKTTGEIEIVPAEVFMDSSMLKIKEFTKKYPKSRIDDKYFDLLQKSCSSEEALKTVIAISVAETGMGSKTLNTSNFFGWFKGGNKGYDPELEIMAEEICKGVEQYYLGIGNDANKVKKYVGHFSQIWLNNFRWAYAQMN